MDISIKLCLQKVITIDQLIVDLSKYDPVGVVERLLAYDLYESDVLTVIKTLAKCDMDLFETAVLTYKHYPTPNGDKQRELLGRCKDKEYWIKRFEQRLATFKV